MSEKKKPDLKPLVDGLKAKKAKRDKVKENAKAKGKVQAPGYYTHLTLPTIYPV